MENDHKQNAADSILTHIRYTQHLALTDNKHLFDNPKWQQRFWRIVFSTCSGGKQYFMIGSDDDMTSSTNASFTKEEAATDPSTGKPYFWTNSANCDTGGDGTVSKDIFLTKKFGITAITASGGCTAKHIGFDNTGRPHSGFTSSTSPNYANIITSVCTFTFTLSDNDTFAITIQPETGYAQIVGQDDS
ncbi:N-terminal methylation [hydrothermal vent metagenome]|uniref:N-terminal methylation n=1 Tax=hydrothermal vent metagenome TaxID=652676 RepID=A0A1W1D0B3_9ZZZZ